MTDPHPNVIANNPPVLRCDNEPCLFHHLGICQFHCHQWLPIKYRATHTPAAPADLRDGMEIRFRTKREAWEQGYQDGESAVQHDLNLIKDAAAKAEREKVIEILGDLNKYSCEEYEEASLSDNEREMRIHLEYGNRTWGIIRSLRGGGAP